MFNTSMKVKETNTKVSRTYGKPPTKLQTSSYEQNHMAATVTCNMLMLKPRRDASRLLLLLLHWQSCVHAHVLRTARTPSSQCPLCSRCRYDYIKQKIFTISLSVLHLHCTRTRVGRIDQSIRAVHRLERGWVHIPDSAAPRNLHTQIHSSSFCLPSFAKILTHRTQILVDQIRLPKFAPQ